MFRGIDPYGTPGGQDSLSVATEPPDIRTAIGRSFAAFLRVNGELSIRDASALEIITRTITNPTGGQMVFFDSYTIAPVTLNVSDTNKVVGSKSVTLPTGNFDIVVISFFRAYNDTSSFTNAGHAVTIGGNSSGEIISQHDGGVDSEDIQFHYRNTVSGTLLIETRVGYKAGGSMQITNGRTLIVALPSV